MVRIPYFCDLCLKNPNVKRKENKEIIWKSLSHSYRRKQVLKMEDMNEGFSLIIFPSRSYNWMGLSYPCEWESFIFFLLHHYKEGFLYLYSDNFYFIPVSSGGGAERRKEIQILNIRMPRGDEKEMRMMASGCSDNRICISSPLISCIIITGGTVGLRKWWWIRKTNNNNNVKTDNW